MMALHRGRLRQRGIQDCRRHKTGAINLWDLLDSLDTSAGRQEMKEMPKRGEMLDERVINVT